MFMKDLQTSMSKFSFPYSALLKQRHCLKKNTGNKCSSYFPTPILHYPVIHRSKKSNSIHTTFPHLQLSHCKCMHLFIVSTGGRILLSNSLPSFLRIRWAASGLLGAPSLHTNPLSLVLVLAWFFDTSTVEDTKKVTFRLTKWRKNAPFELRTNEV